MVLLSHLDVRMYDLNIGVIAVVIFYILAGFVVSYLYDTIIPSKSKILNLKFSILNYKLFIKDRIKRIFPLYLFVISLTTIFLLVTNYANPHFTLFKIITNLTIIPLNYYMVIDNAILSTPHWWLIPPTWSLGTELQAYILLPFALVFPKIKYLFITISFLIYIIANFGLIQPDYFGYRLIIGVIFIFLLGTSIQKISSNTSIQFDKFFLSFIWIMTIILIFILIYLKIDTKGYARETSIGIISGIPLVYFLSKSKTKYYLNKFLGSLSYGLFLSHFLVIWIMDYLSIYKSSFIYIIEVIGLSILIGLIGIYIENIYIYNNKKLKKKCIKNVD